LARWVGGEFGAVRAGVADFNAESAIAQGLSNRAGFVQGCVHGASSYAQCLVCSVHPECFH